MKHESALAVDLGVRSADHPNVIGINLHEMYARLCQLEELIDKTPRVTQYQVRQALKRMAALEVWVTQNLEVLAIHQTVLDILTDRVLGDDRVGSVPTQPADEQQDALPGL